MNAAERIVSVLLDDAGNVHFDVHQRPDLYLPTGQTTPKGQKVVVVCANCEADYGADKQYPPDVSVSHGICPRHTIHRFMSDLGFTREQAASKVSPTNKTPDWRQIEGLTTLDSPNKPQGEWKGGGFPGSPAAGDWPKPPAKACTIPKATFWATSGSGA